MVGGVAARLNLTLENLDDLETALEAALERAMEPGEVTVMLRIAAARSSPASARSPPRACAPSSSATGTRPSSLRRVLGHGRRRLPRSIREGWLELTKNVERQEAAT